MLRAVLLFAAAALVGLVSCEPVTIGMALLAATTGEEETENFVLINEPDTFFRSADHHNFKGFEVYSWRNCGEAALVDLEVLPSCPNDVTVTIYDAEDVLVYTDTYHAPHCGKGKKDWPPVPTATGTPGVWRIELTFDITGVNELEILITRFGPCELDVTVHGNNGVGNGLDPQPPGQPPVNDGPCTLPGDPGSQGSGAHWESARTEDRDVEETYFLCMHGDTAAVQASWEELSAGEIELTVKDAAGLIVYTRLFAPGHAQPFADLTAAGTAGVWTVTFRAQDLTSKQLDIIVHEP